MFYGWLTAGSLFLKTCIAIGIVLASPDKNNAQPTVLRFAPLNLSASNRPAPNPIAPRVAAIIAISGTVNVLKFDFDICTLLTFTCTPELCITFRTCCLTYHGVLLVIKNTLMTQQNTSTMPFRIQARSVDYGVLELQTHLCVSIAFVRLLCFETAPATR